MNNYDIVIVGNGIISYSVCYGLIHEDPSLKIAIIGPYKKEAGATSAAGAMLNCFAELTSLSLKTKAGRAKFNMGVDALRMWPTWLEEINSSLNKEDKIAINPGTFVIHNAKSGKLDSIHYNSILKGLSEYNEAYEKVDPNSIKGLNPVDDCRALEAIYLPNEGSINPNNIFAAFEKIFSNNSNIFLIDDEVEEIITELNNHLSIKLKSKQVVSCS